MNWRLVLSAAALVLGLAACGDSGEGENTPLNCSEGLMLCGGACADTRDDPRNCGACGTVCGDGEICRDGVCTFSCPSGQVACGDGCYNLSASPNHCGACGNACDAGQVCSEGACDSACPAGQVECEGGCFDTATSRDHCGACGNACADGESCTDGACVAVCPGSQQLCDGGCFDLDSSRTHCGACGVACGAGEVCVNGGCAPTCPPGQTDCDGTCVALGTNPSHCGQCGNACGVGEVCVDGNCELSCASGLAACGGSCVDTRNDRNNCGGCGIACGDSEICSDGTCVTSCWGFASTQCGDTCTNTDVDPLNCGACGNACAPGEVCSAGACTGYCAPALTECQDGACTDTRSDPANCGSCGTSCPTVANAAAVCAVGNCDVVCLEGHGDCNGDLRHPGGDGCEVTFATDPLNCGFCGNVCTAPNGVPSCVDGECGLAACMPGFGDCDLSAFNGCETNITNDPANCGACGNVCGINQYCQNSQCHDRVDADTCATPVTLTGGNQQIHWFASQQDYITAPPACSASSSYLPTGPDLVFRYDATFNGQVEIDFKPPSGTRWHAVVADGSCGDLTSQVACLSASGSLSGAFQVAAGQTYYIYLVDSTSGANPLSNPLNIEVTELNCATLAPVATTLAPANGAINPTLTGQFQVTFSHAINPVGASFTLTGDRGTVRTFASDASEVTISSNNRTVTIAAGDFLPNENVTITWSGLTDAVCGTAVAMPTWVVTMPAPPCAPGAGSMVGDTYVRVPLGLLPGSSFTEYYVEADRDPNGYVYVGGSTALYRIPKAGGPPEDLVRSTSITSSNLGYHMAIDGDSIFVQRSASTATNQIWRLSGDGGVTWDPVDAVSFPTAPGSTLNGTGAWEGKLFMITHQGPGLTQIFSADVSGALPATATLETTFAGDTNNYQFCGGMAADDRYFYTTCRKGPVGSPYKVLRIDRVTHERTEIGTTTDYETMGSPIRVADTDGDGLADFLYQKGKQENVRYVCSPTTTPYVDELVRYGDSTGNGLGYDPVNNVVWAFDDDTFELIKIE